MHHPFGPWPYAALAVSISDRISTICSSWLYFPIAMNQNVLPLITDFVVRVSAVDFTPFAIRWNDAYTIKLRTNVPPGPMSEVFVTYLGPMLELRTTYHKQWEPWFRLKSDILNP